MSIKSWTVFLLAALICVTAFGCGMKDNTDIADTLLEGLTQQAPQSTSDGDTAEAQPPASITPEETEPDYAQLYSATLDKYYDLIANCPDGYSEDEGMIGAWEIASYTESGEALKSIGYAISDVSGDGIPELLICTVDSGDGVPVNGSEVLAVYTYVDGAPRLTFEGWGRNCYYYMGGGRFYNSGSGGAAFYIFGAYTVSQDGTGLICDDLYYTYPHEDNYEDIGLYHNTSGDFEDPDTEELDMTDEEFYAIDDSLAAQKEPIALTPFSEYTGAA